MVSDEHFVSTHLVTGTIHKIPCTICISISPWYSFSKNQLSTSLRHRYRNKYYIFLNIKIGRDNLREIFFTFYEECLLLKVPFRNSHASSFDFSVILWPLPGCAAPLLLSASDLRSVCRSVEGKAATCPGTKGLLNASTWPFAVITRLAFVNVMGMSPTRKSKERCVKIRV